MNRRKKSSTIENLIDIVAVLPWWAGVVLAIVSYLALHQVASLPVVTAVQPSQSGSIVIQTIWKGLATGGQYLLPLIFLAGAGISAWRRHERAALVKNAAKSDSADGLNGMSWQQFEKLVGEAFRLQGYAVVETGGGGADGGVDLVLSQGGEKFLVQCKQWRAFKVGVDVVRELYGVMAAKAAAGGFVVTSGRFTDDAITFASGRNVTLIDGPKLHGMIRQAQAKLQSASWSAPNTPGSQQPAPAAGHSAIPTCPVCSKPMVKRRSRRGANAGGEFWGCTAYPACKGTSAIGKR